MWDTTVMLIILIWGNLPKTSENHIIFKKPDKSEFKVFMTTSKDRHSKVTCSLSHQARKIFGIYLKTLMPLLQIHTLRSVNMIR